MASISNKFQFSVAITCMMGSILVVCVQSRWFHYKGWTGVHERGNSWNESWVEESFLFKEVPWWSLGYCYIFLRETVKEQHWIAEFTLKENALSSSFDQANVLYDCCILFSYKKDYLQKKKDNLSFYGHNSSDQCAKWIAFFKWKEFFRVLSLFLLVLFYTCGLWSRTIDFLEIRWLLVASWMCIGSCM